MTTENYQEARDLLLALPGPVDIADGQAVHAERERMALEAEALQSAALRGSGEEAGAWASHLMRRAWLMVHLAERDPALAPDARAAVEAWQEAESGVVATYLGQRLTDETEAWLSERPGR